MPNYYEVDGHRYSDGVSDEGTGVRHLDNRGWRNWLVPLFADTFAYFEALRAVLLGARDEAGASAGVAGAAQGAAEAAQSAAEVAEASTILAATAAQSSRDQAAAWAEEAEDTEVAPGLFSAAHWAAKAAESADVAQGAVGGVKVTAADTTAGVLADKVTAGAGLSATVTNAGADEGLTLAAEVTPDVLAAGSADAYAVNFALLNAMRG